MRKWDFSWPIVALIALLSAAALAAAVPEGEEDDPVEGGMAADALVSLGVVGAGVAILLTGERWIDPLASLVIVAVIALGSWGLLRDSVKMGLLAVPDAIDEAEVRAFLSELPGVAAVHDLHIWPMSTTETALTAHLVMPGGYPGDTFLRDLSHRLEHEFHIGHATVQVETGAEDDCHLHGAHGHG